MEYENEYQDIFRSIEQEIWNNESYNGIPVPRENVFTYRFKVLFDKLNMVGDSVKNDIQGARNAGIKSIWYNPEHVKNMTNIVPDYEITNLLELKNMF